MKILLRPGTIIILLLSVFLTVALVSGCSSEQGQTTPRDTGGDDDDDDDAKDDRRKRAKLKCELPKCSGSDCCDKEDSDGDLDEDCEDWCKKDLSLSGDAYDNCLALDRAVIAEGDEDDLLFLFDERLKRPQIDELETLKTKEVDLICAAVKHLDSDLLSDRVDNYGSADSEGMLEWLATKETVLEIFDSAEDDDGLKMVKKLLETAAALKGDAGILKGLGTDVSDDSDDDNVLELALKAKNKEFVNFIHDDIITHEDEICSKENQPSPDTLQILPSTGTYPDQGYGYEACVLAAYCKIAPNNTDADNDFRKDIADFVSENSVVNFIRRKAEDGGLDIADAELDDTSNPPDYYQLDEDDAEEWSYKACVNLKYFWDNKTGKTLFDLSP